MAINITPILKIVKNTISYEVYHGNLNLTPIDFDVGAVVFTCVGTKPLSTPQYITKPIRGDNKRFQKVWVMYTVYNYQMDVLKTITKTPYASPLVPFEFESFAIINNIQSKAGELLKDHDLGISYFTTRFSVETTHNKPTNRMTASFEIISPNKVKIKSTEDRVECGNIMTTQLHPGKGRVPSQ